MNHNSHDSQIKRVLVKISVDFATYRGKFREILDHYTLAACKVNTAYTGKIFNLVYKYSYASEALKILMYKFSSDNKIYPAAYTQKI